MWCCLEVVFRWLNACFCVCDFFVDLCPWNAVADGTSSAPPAYLSHARHHRHRTRKSPAAAEANVAVDEPSSVDLKTSKSKRDIIATSSAAGGQLLTSRPRSASAEASNTAAVSDVHSASRVVTAVEQDNGSRAPQITYHRRWKKLKKNVSVAGVKQRKTSSSRELSLWHHMIADAVG